MLAVLLVSLVAFNVMLRPINANTELLEAIQLATNTTKDFVSMFTTCIGITMPNQQFLVDNLQSLVNYPSKTTVGFAPKFTSNRKFFANLITTTAFKEMMDRDMDQLRRDAIKKMRFCDNAVMDQEQLMDFYDREVDQTKL